MTDKSKYNAAISRIPMPARIAKLPIDERGYPVPWFVQYIKDGEASEPGVEGSKPDFRVMNAQHYASAVRQKLCWTCGEPLGQFMCFVIGPMCVVNRISSEPPSHLECGVYAALACPFLSNPRMRRNNKDLPAGEMAGFGIERNPGVTCLWVTKDYTVFRPHAGGKGPLIRIGKPHSLSWYAHGTTATREEILESINTGFPLLERMAAKDGPDGLREIRQQRESALKLLPAA